MCSPLPRHPSAPATLLQTRQPGLRRTDTSLADYTLSLSSSCNISIFFSVRNLHLDLLQACNVFETAGAKLLRVICGYHWWSGSRQDRTHALQHDRHKKKDRLAAVSPKSDQAPFCHLRRDR